jgi:hypothetical protein
MVSSNCFVNPESIQCIKITGDYCYIIHFEGEKFLEFTIKDKSVLAVDFVKNQLLPLLMKEECESL